MVRRLAIAITAALLIGAPAAHATMPGENGKIAYFSYDGGGVRCCSIHTVTPSPDPLLRNDTNLTADQFAAKDPAWSPDGTRIAYVSYPSVNAPSRIWVMNADGSGKQQLSPDSPWSDISPTWSPDGKTIAFAREGSYPSWSLWFMNSDGSNPYYPIVNQYPVETGGYIRWSPDGSRLDLSGAIVNADGTNRVHAPTGDWSPSGNWFITSGIYHVTPDGAYTSQRQETGVPTWSPDGRYLAVWADASRPGIFVRSEGTDVAPGGVPSSGFFVSSGDDYDPDWQPLPPFVPPGGYPRPRGAGPLDVSLVPAYQSCDAPNTTHGPPLTFGSCGPPAQESSTLTAGTPDANGQGARFVGRARLTPVPGNPSTPQDEADVRIAINVSDVRCQAGGMPGCDAPLSDYSGDLRGTFDLTMTDKNNGGSGVESATVKTIPYYSPALPVTVPCVSTADTTLGSTCSVSTTADAIAGNIAHEGERSTWAIGQVQLWDSGPDGNINSDDNTLFAVQGVFVP